MYHVEVSKSFGPSWLLVPVNALGGIGRSRYQTLPWSAGVQANLAGIHAISWTMHAI